MSLQSPILYSLFYHWHKESNISIYSLLPSLSPTLIL